MYTISEMTAKTPTTVNGKVTEYLTGYAFMDEFKHCFIIVYGENKRDFVINKLK